MTAAGTLIQAKISVKKAAAAALVFAVSAVFRDAGTDPLQEYAILMRDLRNRNLYGYKGHLDPVTLAGGRIIPDVQGALERTGDPFDVAVLGEGFFRIMLTDAETAYTRNGDFSVNGEGNLSTADGFQLYDTIRIPPGCSEISVGADGTVRAGTGNGKIVGMLKLYGPDAERMTGERGAIVLTDEENPAGIEAGTGGRARMMNGMLEQSSVDILPTLRRMHALLGLMNDEEMPDRQKKMELLVNIISDFNDQGTAKPTDAMIRLIGEPNR